MHAQHVDDARFQRVNVNGKEVSIKKDPVTGSAMRIDGHKININNYNEGRAVTATDTVATKLVLSRLINDLEGLPSFTNSSMTINRYRHDDKSLMVRFGQEIDGIPIDGAYFGLTTDQNGAVLALGGQTYNLDNVNAQSVSSSSIVNSETIEALFEQDIQVIKSELVYTMTKSGQDQWQAIPAWKVEVNGTTKPMAEQVYVHANTGQIIKRVNKLKAAKVASDPILTYTQAPLFSGTISGTLSGPVYPEKATDSPSNENLSFKFEVFNVSSALVSSGTANSSGYYSTGHLATGTYYPKFSVENSYFKAMENTGSGLQPIYHSTSSGAGTTVNYTFSTSQATSSFHHANSFRSHFAAYPFSHTGLNFKQDIEITNSFDDNGYSQGTKIGFGRQDYQYWAHSSDIVFHEMGHSLTYSIYGDWIGDYYTEGGAMDEGFSDYLAASLNSDPQMGTDVGISNRDLSAILSYDTDYLNDPGHLNGRIIGGAMWELQGEIGASTAQHLWYKAMHVEPQAHTFEDFLYNLYIADYQNYAAANWDDIEDAFDSRDISTARPEMNVTVSGPTAITEGYYNTWTASVTFNPSSVSYEWFTRPMYSTDPWTSLSVYTASLYTTFFDHAEIKVEVTSGSESDLAEHFITVEEDCSSTICLSQVDTPLQDVDDEQPVEYALHGNYPNPFNPSTQIAFSLAADSPVRLSVFDVTGRLIQVLVNRDMQKGAHTISWTAMNAPSGIYFYRLDAGVFNAIGKMSLIK